VLTAPLISCAVFTWARVSGLLALAALVAIGGADTGPRRGYRWL
jgi:hypothetical protein